MQQVEVGEEWSNLFDMTWLKVELHTHTSEDPRDKGISYSAIQLVDYLVTRGYDALAVTLHTRQYFPKTLQHYAAERGLLLIPGIEANIQRRHVLLYNFDFDHRPIHTFDALRQYKTDENLVIAPHPYYPGSHSLQFLLEQQIDVFDAIEYCHFYLKGINLFNRWASQTAQRFHLPLIGTADAHYLQQIGWTYTLVEAEKSVEGIIDAIKKGRVQIITQPLPLAVALRCLRAVRSKGRK